MNKTKQLIKELKEEIEKREKWVERRYEKEIENVPFMKDEDNYLIKLRAQLQFAEKLIKALKDDINKISIFDIYSEVVDRYELDQHSVMEMFHIYRGRVNKILNEVLK